MVSSVNGISERHADDARRELIAGWAGVRRRAELEDEQGHMIPMAGERFGPYEILGTLGRGGVGEVYRAWDSRLEREIAIKLLHEDYPQPAARERFLIEGRASSALSHPNICTIFDMGEKDGAPYLVMELLKGETLKHRIERGGMAAEEIAEFGMEIADALGAAHAVGIVHRDVKPANIMLVKHPDGRVRVKVLDFGLAKIKGTLPSGISHDEHLTVPGEAVGTVAYMSPEQARGIELDGRSDLFSLGTVMYEMATRRTPFQGSTTPLLFVQLLNETPEPIRDWNDEVPRALEKVIFRLLEKEPAKRFQSAQELIAALSAVVGKPGSARKRKAPPPVPLVRVEEPVARAGFPIRPETKRDSGGSSEREHPERTPVTGARYETPAVIVRRVTHDGEDAIRPVRLASLPEQRPAEDEARVVNWKDPEKPGTEGKSLGSSGEPAGNTLDSAQNPAVPDARVNALRPRFASEVAEEQTRAADSIVRETFPRVVEVAPEEPLQTAALFEEPVLPEAEVEIAAKPEEPEDLAGPGSRWGGTPGRVEPLSPVPAGQRHIEAALSTEPVALAQEPGNILRPAFTVQPIRASETPLRFESEGVNGAYEIGAGDEEIRPGQRARRRRRLLWGASAAGVALATALGALRYGGGGKHALLGPAQRVAVAGIENHTGAQMLDGTAAVALDFALAQDEEIPLVSEASFASSLRALSPDSRPVDIGVARQAALAAGADAYLYGDIAQSNDGVHGSGAGYRVTVVLRDTHSDHELARAQANSDRMEDLPGAVDRVAGSMLEAMYGKRVGGYVPIAREASASLGALHLYAAGVEAEAEGRDAAALKAYSSAASNDPGFVQALVRISWLARAEDAAGASADAAERASAAAEGHSTRTMLLAKATADANSRGNLEDAASSARRLLGTNPEDEDARLLLARAQRLAGQFADASRTAQEGIAKSPRSAEMYTEAELALVALNRANDAAAEMDAEAAAGLGRPVFRDLVDYLAGRAEAGDTGTSTGTSNMNEPGSLAVRGAFLDNTGDLNDADESWSRAADVVRGQSGLGGAANSLLATAALNRALAGDCNRALTLAAAANIGDTKNVDAALRAGVAAGLCGDDEVAHAAESVLSSTRAASSLAGVRTALALGRGDREQAVAEAKDIGQDPIYVGTYLRSLVHLETEQPEAAVAELQETLAHRGAVTLAGTNLYPVAQFALARAFAGAGDRTNSMEAYGRFVSLWDGAGAADPLKLEASQAAHGVMPKQQELVAHLVLNASKPEMAETSRPVVDRPVVARAVALRPHAPKTPLLTGLPASWFEHPAPGQGTGAPVDPAATSGATRGNSMD